MRKITEVTYIGYVVFLTGLLNIISSLFAISIPRLRLLDLYIPFEISKLSRSLTIIIGVFLMFLAQGLLKRKARAWQISIFLIGSSLFLHLLKGLDYEESFILLIPLVILWLNRNLFHVQSESAEQLSARIVKSLIILVLLFIYAFFGYFIFARGFRGTVNVANVIADYQYSLFGIGKNPLKPHSKPAKWFEDSIGFMGFVAIVSIFAELFNPLLKFDFPTQRQREQYRDLVLRYADNSVAYMGLLPDKIYYFSNDNESAIAFKIVSQTAVVLGDPLGNPTQKVELAQSFVRENYQKGLKTVFYSIGPQSEELYKDLGFNLVKIGMEAFIYTDNFDLSGQTRESIRHSMTKLQKQNVRYELYNLTEITSHNIDEFNQLYDAWIQARKIRPLTFSFNFFPLPKEKHAYILLTYSNDNRLLGALTFYPFDGQSGLALDLMIRAAKSPNGTIEASIAHAVQLFGQKGFRKISLGAAPLYDTDWQNKSGKRDLRKLIFDKSNQFYNYKTLATFKQKFDPIWEPIFVAYEKKDTVPSVFSTVIRAQLGS